MLFWRRCCSLVYPVNSGLMTLRSLPNQFSMLALLAAVYLVFDYQKNPTRLRLLGIWLGLLFNVASQETAYAIILVIPLLWWLDSRKLTWRNFNLTVIWYAFPVFKAAWLLLLTATGYGFYRGNILKSVLDAESAAPDVFSKFAVDLANVYHHTFVDGWQRAWSAVGQNTYMALTIVMLAFVGGLAWHLARKDTAFPSVRQINIWLVSGLLLIMPAVGVLIWIERYSGDPWRMYFYVPIAAAIVVFSLIALLTALIARPRYRNATVIILCIILMFPALSRLLLQHERFVDKANKQAIVLHDILETAPQVESDTVLILITEMSEKQFGATAIANLAFSHLANSIFRTLYAPAPAHAALCLTESRCSDNFIKNNLSNMLLIKIHEDLSVELVEQPSVYFGFGSDSTYDARRLYNPDAPLPPRAATMLGSSER